MRKPHILEYQAAIADQTQFSVIDETINQGKGVEVKISSDVKLKFIDTLLSLCNNCLRGPVWYRRKSGYWWNNNSSRSGSIGHRTQRIYQLHYLWLLIWIDSSLRLTLIAPASKVCFELNAVGRYRPDGSGSEIKWKITKTNNDVDEKITNENFVGDVSRCRSFDERIEDDAHVKFYPENSSKVNFSILNSSKLVFIRYTWRAWN